MVVVACLKIGFEFALNFIFILSSSNLANSFLSLIVVKVFHKNKVTNPTATIIPAIPEMKGYILWHFSEKGFSHPDERKR